MIQLPDVQLGIAEADVNTTNGAITTRGPVTIPALPAGAVIIGTAYDSTIPGWRVLYVAPVAQ